MVSWRGAVWVGDAGSIRSDLGGRVILLLVVGVEDTEGASPKSERGQQMMEIGEGSHRSTRFSQFHAGTRRGVEHPRSYNQNYAGLDLDVNHVAGGSVLTVLPSETTTVERMPAVEDLHLLPDMGRMTPSLPWDATTGCLPGVCVRGNVQRP